MNKCLRTDLFIFDIAGRDVKHQQQPLWVQLASIGTNPIGFQEVHKTKQINESYKLTVSVLINLMKDKITSVKEL